MTPSKVILRPKISVIDLADSTLSAFFSDGRGYVEVTPLIVSKLINGELIISEYHEYPLGNVIYVEANAINN